MMGTCCTGCHYLSKKEWQNWKICASKFIKENMELDKDFKEFIELLNEHKVKVEGVEVQFLSLQDLITAKRKAGRLQDLADAEQLEKLEKKKR